MNKTNDRPEFCPKLKTAVLTLGLLAALSACQKQQDSAPAVPTAPSIKIETEAPIKAPVPTPASVVEEKFKMKIQVVHAKLKDVGSVGSLKDLNQLHVQVEVDEQDLIDLNLVFQDHSTKKIYAQLNDKDFKPVGRHSIAEFVVDLDIYPAQSRLIDVMAGKMDLPLTKREDFLFRPDVVIDGTLILNQVIDPEVGRTQLRDLFIKDRSHIHLYGQGLQVDVDDFIVLGQATLQTLSLGPDGIYRRAVDVSKRVYPVVKEVSINANYAEGSLIIENRGYAGTDGLDGEIVNDSVAQLSAPINHLGYFFGPKNECSSFVNWAQTTDLEIFSTPIGLSDKRQMYDGSVNGVSEKFSGLRSYYKCVVQNFLLPLAVQGPSGNPGGSGGPGGSTGSGLIRIKKSYLQIAMPINAPGLGGKKGLGSKGQLGPVQNPNFNLSLESQRAPGTGPSIVPSPLARTVINEFFPEGRGPKGQDGRDGLDGSPGVANKFFTIDQNGKQEVTDQLYKRAY